MAPLHFLSSFGATVLQIGSGTDGKEDKNTNYKVIGPSFFRSLRTMYERDAPSRLFFFDNATSDGFRSIIPSRGEFGKLMVKCRDHHGDHEFY
jgi:hypothetical protein